MHTYILTPEFLHCDDYDAPAPQKVEVRGTDWYGARARAFQDAAENGYERICVIANGVELLHQPHWNGRGDIPLPRSMTVEQHHGLWCYVERLLARYAHVYVPPRGWYRRANAPTSENICAPTVPLVAGYRVPALRTIVTHHGSAMVGLALCHEGHDSFTVFDYFHTWPTSRAPLEEHGTAVSWRRAYARNVSQLTR